MIDVSKYAPYFKAIGAFIVGLASVATVVVAVTSDGKVSASEAVSIFAAVGAWLAGTGVVFAIPNMSPTEYALRRKRKGKL